MPAVAGACASGSRMTISSTPTAVKPVRRGLCESAEPSGGCGPHVSLTQPVHVH